MNFDANFIYELDKACQEVMNFIISKQQEVNQGDVLAGLPGCAKKISFENIPLLLIPLNFCFYYKVYRLLSPVELKKFKKDFLSLSKLHPPKSKDKFGDSFLEFLNAQLLGASD